MKSKLLWVFILHLIFLSWLVDANSSNCTTEQFRITGYYSPLPDQAFYAKGNLSDEIVLNGKGTHGASGKAVFNGMIAAPSLYAFGTKIVLDGRGVWSVEDRWWAIVAKWERWEKYNRIDIWMGHGEEWLRRAMAFWVQYKSGKVCPQESGHRLGFDWKNFPTVHNFFADTLWRVHLWHGRNDPRVWVLQWYLQKSWFLKVNPTNTFWDQTKEALCKFQQYYLWLDSKDFWCGYFGTSTRIAFKKYLQEQWTLWTVTISNDSETQDTVSHASAPSVAAVPVVVVSVPEKEPKSVEISSWNPHHPQANDPKLIALNKQYLEQWESSKYQFWNDIAYGSSSMEVKLLQRKLQWMWYLKTNVSGTYDADTKNALFVFQIDQGILQSWDTSVSRGRLWPKTRTALNAVAKDGLD